MLQVVLCASTAIVAQGSLGLVLRVPLPAASEVDVSGRETSTVARSLLKNPEARWRRTA